MTNRLLIAGAGTGKTFQLVRQALDHVLIRGLDVRLIVALTFTEKAANEMRNRMAETLLGLAANEPVKELDGWDAAALSNETGVPAEILRERAMTTLRSLHQARFDTLHGFAAHLLRLYPAEAGIDPTFEVDDGRQYDEIFDREWAAWLDEELAASGPRREAWLSTLSQVSLSDLRAAVEEAAGSESFRDRLSRPHGRDLWRAAYGASLTQVRGLLDRAGGSRPLKILSQLKTAVDTFEKLLETGYTPDVRKIAEGIGAKISGSKPVTLSGWSDVDYRTAKGLVALAGELTVPDDDRVGSIWSLLSPFILRFRRRFAEEGYLSYEDLLEKAVRLLRNVDVRREVKRRFRAILVDEFQDTDALQCEIVLYLAEREQDAAPSIAQVELEPGKLLLVGDPKQSIYSFRGADIEAFEAVRNRVTATGREERLSTNRRSHSAIIHFVNEVFSRLIRREPPLQPDYDPIEAERKAALPSECVNYWLIRTQDEDASDDEASAIASWVADHAGVDRIRDRTERGWMDRELRFGDVAILFRRLRPVPPYLEAFRKAGIPYIVEGEKFFYESPEVVDLVNLLCWIENPADGISALGVLRSPIGGLSDREIFELAPACLDYRREAVPVLGPLFSILRDLNGRAFRVRPDELAREAVARLHLVEMAVLRSDGEQAVANLEKALRAISSRSHDGTSLGRVTQWLRRVVHEREEEGESPLADETLDAVRVLSIHKAKGLEFPVVIVPRCGHGPGEGRDPLAINDWALDTAGLAVGPFKSSAYLALLRKRKRKLSAEERRIFYVACTRAKERLILSGAPAKRFQPDSFHSMLESALGRPMEPAGPCELGTARFDVVACERPTKVIGIRTSPGVSPTPIDPGEFIRSWNQRQEEYTRVRALERFTSPSRMDRKTHEDVEKRIDLGEEESPRRHAAAVGIACHRILELWPFPKTSFDGIAEVCAEISRECDVPQEALSHEVAELIRRFASSEAFAELLASEILARELPFVLKEGEQIISGVIDVLYRHEGKLVVADYKTDRVTADEAARHAAGYANQRRLYTEAIRRLFPNDPVEFRLIFLRLGRSHHPE